MSNQKDGERVFMKEFIGVYRGLPGLWMVKSKEYSNRQLKSQSYELLLNKYRERYADAEKEDVKKKINVLRTNFRKETRRVTGLRAMGVRTKPALWYYEDLLFIQEQETATEGTYGTGMGTDVVKEESSREEEWTSNNILVPVSEPTNPTPPKRMKMVENRVEEFVDPGSDHPMNNEEYMTVAIGWTNELRKMTPVQQLFAKKAVNDILFEGQLGTLHRHSVTINRPSSPSLYYSRPNPEPSNNEYIVMRPHDSE